MRRVFPVVLLLLAFVPALAQSSQPVALRLRDITGRTFSLAGYKGKIVLVNFWATWCIPCRTEIPDLIKLQRQYRRQGLRIVGITYPPERILEVRRFARQLRMNYPVALGSKETKSHFTPSETLPMTVVIDREGIVRDVIEGIMYSDEFDQKVKPVLFAERTKPTKESHFTKKTKPPVRQNATILVDAKGYRPPTVILRRGMRAQLTFIRTTEQTCGKDILIPDYGINRPLPLNTPVIVTLTPSKSGRFKFTCGMNMLLGSLVVQ